MKRARRGGHRKKKSSQFWKTGGDKLWKPGWKINTPSGGAASAIAIAFMALLIVLGFTSCAGIDSAERTELARTYFNLGNAYFEMGRWAESEQAFARSLELDPDFHRAAFNRARVLIKLDRTSTAVTVLEALLREDPENITVMELLAWALVEEGRPTRAQNLYRAILKEDPGNCNVRYNLALFEKERGDWEELYELLIYCADAGQAGREMLFLLFQAERELGRGSGFYWLSMIETGEIESLQDITRIVGDPSSLPEEEFERFEELLEKHGLDYSESSVEESEATAPSRPSEDSEEQSQEE
ncbi:MAG TPA: tetratricopeptide repeat protein [Sediminispirochaeta sp.]|nr:tetratricopeptide repeat protein [Sediminispirochaeta sp.]